MLGYSLYDLAAILPRVAANAAKQDINIIASEIEAWPQEWSNTSCGFGGLAGQGFTTAITVVLKTEMPSRNGFHVFHAGQYAYTIKEPTNEFWEDYRRRKLLGASSAWRHNYESPSRVEE